MSKSIAYAITIAAVAVVMSGCRTNKDILDDYERSMCAGRYAEPIAEIEEKAEGGGVDELMWRLHAGGSRFLNGERELAIGQFDRAEDIFLKNDAQSVFAQSGDTAFAMVTNDRAFPYAGAGEDRIFACLYKAIDYAAAGDNAAARTELNRVQQHQDNWLDERRKEIAEAEEKLKKDSADYARSNEQSENTDKVEKSSSKAFSDADFGAKIRSGCGFDPATDGRLDTLARKDWVNSYATHVTGVFRWLAGDGDAVNYFRETAELRSSNPMVTGDLAAVKAGGKPKDQVWLFIEDGLCPCREEWRIDLPLVLIPYANRFVQYAGMAFPKLRYRNAGCGAYALEAGGTSYAVLELEDIDRLMKTEFDVYFRGALTREITRTIVKVGVQVGFGIAAETTNNDNAKLGFRIAQFSAAAWAASVTQADLRSWTGLPKKVYAVRVTRPSDGHLVLKGDGMPVADITLPQGNAMVFVRKPAPGATAVVKTVNFAN